MDARSLLRLAPAAVVVALTATTAATAAANPLQRTVRDWTVRHPQTGIYIARLESERVAPVVNVKGNIGRRPASTMKLVTAAAALRVFGATHRFSTQLLAPSAPIPGGSHLNSTLYLRGGGDPMLATPAYISLYLRGGIGSNITRLAGPLRSAGFRSISGTIIVDESRFDSQRRVASWPARYAIESAPFSAVNVNQGHLKNVKGKYVSNPPLMAGARLRAAFRRVGIAHTGAVTTGRTPATAVPVATLQSPQLKYITRAMLPSSDNYVAETLTKSTGVQVLGRGTTRHGTHAAQQVLGRWIGSRNRLIDGSGLDRGNRITPRSMVRLLAAAHYDRSWGRPLTNSMPRGGEGTLRTRLTAPALRSRVRAKTGYIAATSTIAGFVTSRRGHRYAFALYMNDYSITDATRTQDRIITQLARGFADGL